jgi:hypothetical protein
MKPLPRSIEFTMANSLEDCTEGATIQMTLFSVDAELRSHALGHLARISEMEKGWEKLVPRLKQTTILETLDNLKKLGCPWITKNTFQHKPICINCRLYDHCTPSVSYVEACYLEAVTICVQKSLEYPRVASYTNGENKKCLDGGPQLNIFFGSIYENQEIGYRLQTCYADTKRLSYRELVEHQKRKIHYKSNKNTINWCNPENWNDGPAEIEDRPDRGNSKRYQKKSKKSFRDRLTRYVDEDSLL